MSLSTARSLRRALVVLGTALLVACTGVAPREDTVRKDPAHAALELGRAHYAAGRYGLAIDHLERELARYPTSLAAMNGLGACYDGLGRHEVARRYYMQALAIAPDAPKTLGNLGRSYLADGRPADAVAVLVLAAAAAPDDPWIAAILAQARAALPPEAVASAPVVAVTAPVVTAPVVAAPVVAAPVVAAPVVAAPVVAAPVPRLEVSNGNGVDGLAQAVSTWLASERWLVTRVTNAKPFDKERTEVQHTAANAAAARALAATLPVECALVESPARPRAADIRLVLGADLFSHLARGIDGPVLAWLAPSGAVAAGKRVEVSNGNGVVGLARRVGASLRAEGATVTRITNARSYANPETVVMHRPDADAAAQQVAAWLPLRRVKLVATAGLAPTVDVRIVLGRDIADLGGPHAELAAVR